MDKKTITAISSIVVTVAVSISAVFGVIPETGTTKEKARAIMIESLVQIDKNMNSVRNDLLVLSEDDSDKATKIKNIFDKLDKLTRSVSALREIKNEE